MSIPLQKFDAPPFSYSLLPVFDDCVSRVDDGSTIKKMVSLVVEMCIQQLEESILHIKQL
jgi:hypothetical protein